MNYKWQDVIWKNCNQQSIFPSVLSLSVALSYFYIKEKLVLSTQKKSHSVDSLLFFIFSPSSVCFMWAALSSFWRCSVFVFFSSWGQTGSPKTWAPRCIPCSVFVTLSSVLPVSEVLFAVCLWLRLRWEARPGQVRRMRRCEKAHGVTNAFETCVLCFRRRWKATEAHSAGDLVAVKGSRSVTAFKRSGVHSSHTDLQCRSLKICGSPLWICMWGYSSNRC